MKRVYVASPFQGATVEETRQNIVYARLCMLDSLGRNEAPYLSHLLYTQVWSEAPALREAGLTAGDAWRGVADLVAVYQDLGVTPGMQRALTAAHETRTPAAGRNLGGGALPTTIDDWRAYLATVPLDDFPALGSGVAAAEDAVVKAAESFRAFLDGSPKPGEYAVRQGRLLRAVDALRAARGR